MSHVNNIVIFCTVTQYSGSFDNFLSVNSTPDLTLNDIRQP